MRTRGLLRQIKRAVEFSNPLLTVWRSQSLFPPGRFIAGCKDKEGILKMLELALA